MTPLKTHNYISLNYKTRRSHVFSGAFRRSLVNKRGIPSIVYLNDENFAGQACPDRLPQKICDKKEFCNSKYINNIRDDPSSRAYRSTRA